MVMAPTSSSANHFKGLDIGEQLAPELAKKRDEVLKAFDEHINVNKQYSGFLSDDEAKEQKDYITSLFNHPENIDDAWDGYASPTAKARLKENIELYKEFAVKLNEAKRGNRETGNHPAISDVSHKEWMSWVRSSDISAHEKTSSLNKGYFEKYLTERWTLAKDRGELLQNKQLKKPEEITDPAIRERVYALEDDRLYFDTLEFSQRRNLIDTLTAAISTIEGGKEYKELFDQAKKVLDDATLEPQPALHRDKVGTWLKRIFTSKSSLKEKADFVHGNGKDSLSELIKRWRDAAVIFWTVRADEAFDGVKTNFINTKKFLDMHYNDRLSYVHNMMLERKNARSLRERAESRINQSSSALGPGGKKRWLDEYVFNGKLNISELRSIIGGDMTVRLENKVQVFGKYKKLMQKGGQMQAFRGKQIFSQSAFLKLHYDKQLQEVGDLENRLEDIENSRPDLLEIRHFMDRGEWKEALELIQDARKKSDLLPTDMFKLSSMESVCKAHAGEQKEEEGGDDSLAGMSAEVDALIDGVAPEFQTMCRILCQRGSKSINALNWTSYNRDWCQQHGYLDYKREKWAIEHGKDGAKAKGRTKNLRSVYNQTIQGETGEEEFIELSRVGPTNVCVDLTDNGAVSAYIESMHHNRSDTRALYWTNAIFHRGGNPMNITEQRKDTWEFRKMRNVLRKIEAKKGHYIYKQSSKFTANPENN